MPVNRIVDESAAGAVDGLSGDRNTQQMLTWLKDAGFGLFIHWSVDVQLGCVISHSLVGASREYADRFYDELPRTFNPQNWDADEVARLARISGAQYAVFTTKHHNGFCMWDTATTPFNIINTPYGRDIVAQYVQAFRAQGLKVGFYYSPEDFRFLYDNAQTITRTPTSPYPADVMARYRAYLTAQMTELMTRFGKIDLIFFDGGELMRDETGESLQELCKRIAWDLQPGILVTRGAIKTPEQSLPGVGMSETWEACITLASAWGYQPTNEIYKTGYQAIELLATTRALGGALLLNIAPDSSGAISPIQEGLLREIGLWNFINREAVLGVRPWILAREGDAILMRGAHGEPLRRAHEPARLGARRAARIHAQVGAHNPPKRDKRAGRVGRADRVPPRPGRPHVHGAAPRRTAHRRHERTARVLRPQLAQSAGRAHNRRRTGVHAHGGAHAARTGR